MKNHYVSQSALRVSRSAVLAVLFLAVSAWQVAGQVSTYDYVTDAGTYASVTGATILGNVDDGNSAATNIGFTFNFNGTNFTQFRANSNGHIRLGATAPTNNYAPISTTNNTNAIAAVARDGRSTGGVVHAVTGVSPNRVCVIQYTNFDLVWNATTHRVSFQIRLYETTNVVEIIYTGAIGTTTESTVQIGLRGGHCCRRFQEQQRFHCQLGRSGGRHSE